MIGLGQNRDANNYAPVILPEKEVVFVSNCDYFHQWCIQDCRRYGSLSTILHKHLAHTFRDIFARQMWDRIG
jgi:hypothetical protein